MKHIFVLAIAFAAQTFVASAQNFQQQFNELCGTHDIDKIGKLLPKWKAATPNDPELYVAYYNYYVQKSRRDVVALGTGKPNDKEAMKFTDKDTTKEKVVGYVYDDISYEPGLLKTGFAYIDTAIQKFPNRLDMRFGKIFMLGEIGDYERYTIEIIKTIDYSHKNKNAWLWTKNAKRYDAKEFFLNAIQDYQMKLYDTNDDALLDNMKRIAEAVLKYYPKHVESLSNLSIGYMIKGEFDKALVPLLKAEEIAPQDYIVLGNIAHCYKKKGDKKNAIKYYELVEKYGDEQGKAQAKKQLAELKK